MELSIVWEGKVCWRRVETTDQEGYAPMEFNFVNGQNVVAEVKEHIRGASAYQETLFASKCYLTEVETWIERAIRDVYLCLSIFRHQKAATKMITQNGKS